MKITIYELLGLIKDGKAPKKIKYDDEIWDYDNDVQDYHNIYYLLGDLFDRLPTNEFINNEVEIIEENKKIEKIDDRHYDEINQCYYGRNELSSSDLVDKINELIDEINQLKEND